MKVMSARAVKEAVKPLAAQFTRDTGISVEFVFAPVGGVRKRLADGEAADIVILSASAIEELASAGALVPGSRRDLGRTSIGMAVRDGARLPDIATSAAFRATLLAARSIAMSDVAVGGMAGLFLTGLFERMGLADAIAHKIVRTGGGNEVAERVADGDAEIGMTFISEILAVKGAHVVGPLPAPLGNDTIYAAAVTAASGEPAAAPALIAAFTRADTRAIWQAAGFALAG
jgi:molybdate transport system substrate-binding protein